MLTAAIVIVVVVVVVTGGDGGGRHRHGRWGGGWRRQWWAVDNLTGCLPVVALMVTLGVVISAVGLAIWISGVL